LSCGSTGESLQKSETSKWVSFLLEFVTEQKSTVLGANVFSALVNASVWYVWDN
jgi:hypothetical protein